MLHLAAEKQQEKKRKEKKEIKFFFGWTDKDDYLAQNNPTFEGFINVEFIKVKRLLHHLKF